MKSADGKVMSGRSRLVLVLLAAVFSLFLAMAVPAKAEAASLKLSKKKVTLYLAGKKTAQITATYKGTPVAVKFSSSRKKIASVSKNGVITGKKAGTCTITAKYGKKKVKCKVVVKSKTAAYRKAVKKYNAFLMQPYVTYLDSGARKQADNFFSLDLDGNGIPELFTGVVSGPDRYYVLYNFNGSRISFGQRLGAATLFTWYPNAKVLGYRTFSGNKSYFHYARYDGTYLYDEATVVEQKGKSTYYIDGDKTGVMAFREFVDHDMLAYEGAQQITPYVNTPQNRSAYLN